MDSFELNKIMGAVLGTLLFVMGIGFVAEAAYAPIEDRGPGYALPEPEGDGHGGAPAPVVEAVPLPVLLASASAEDGAKVARKCASCHSFEQGGANKAGPGLYGVVGNPIGAHEGYAYSPALQELNAAGETWTYENLDTWLQNPGGFASGTKMVLKLGSEKDRADMLAYLQTLSNSPVPFPEVAEAPAADDAEMAADADAAPEDMSADAPAAH